MATNANVQIEETFVLPDPPERSKSSKRVPPRRLKVAESSHRNTGHFPLKR